MDYARAHVHFGASQDDTLKLAILTFQVNFGLSQTGELNEETMLNEETHGDGAPFDGPKGVLAHAFAPDDGHLHFDADENWSFRSRTIDAYHFETVATHEIGHILGMGHSTDIDALMFPSISMGEIKELDVDDIYGISVLYPPPF
ncbi:interstitial collagenase [Salvia divinorum]|uniref:Interstitial collagenase n=1 Tax=Salvia divinorum TaxID=28513 RepID=A0ABD1FWP7_SALDI